MELLGREQHLCPCYKECQEFQKLVELMDSGLVVYYYRPRKENIRLAEEVESAGIASKDVFIIYNKKNVKIPSSELTAELEKESISCPRCRKTFEHAQKLMQEVKSIYRKTVMGICDQCRKKVQQSKKPLCVCDKIVKKFISDKGEQKEDKQYQNAYSDLQINRGVTSPPSKHKPEIQQMFSKTHSKSDGTELSKTNLKEGYVKQAGAFIQPIEPVKTSSAHKLVETSVGMKELPRPKDHKQGEIFEDKPSMHAKEALKRRHDLSLRQMMKPEKESEVPKRPEPYILETTVIKKQEKKAKLDENSSHLIKNTQDKFHLQAEKEKTREEEERLKNLALEVKRRTKAAEEKQRQLLKSQKKNEDEQNKLKGEQRKHEGDQKKLAEHKKISKKDSESKTVVVKEKKQNEPRRDTSKEMDGEIISESKLKGKISKAAKKPVMPKPDPDELLKKQLLKSHKENLARKPQAAKDRDEIDRKGQSKEENITPDATLVSVSKTQKTLKKETPVKEKSAKMKQKKEKESEENITPDATLVSGSKIQKTLKKETPVKEKTAKMKQKKEKESEENITPDATLVSVSKIQKTLNKDTPVKEKTAKMKQDKEKESEEEPIKKKTAMVRTESINLQKLQAQHLKVKAEALEKKKQLEYEAKLAERKAKADELERQNMQKERSDDNLKLDLINQASKVFTFDIDPEVLKNHKCNHQHSGKKSSDCPLCTNSDLELELLSLDDKKKLDNTDIIIGEKIFKYKPRLENIIEPEDVPILFHKEFREEMHKTKPERHQILLTKIEKDFDKGVIRYALSDRTFIDKGWTMLPTEKVVRKMNVYRMRPAKPEFDWFEHNKDKQQMSYDTGERLAEFDDNGRGRLYYRNGRLALDYYDAEETNAQQRFVVYSSGEPDERGRTHPITVLATFDYLGNGIVFDHAGKIRLKYNQTEGVVLDRGIGPITHWQWHSLNDPPVLQQVMIDTQLAHKDPGVLKLGAAADRKTVPNNEINEEMLAIEFDNFIKEKSKKLSQKFKPFQIRMKALKINEHFSLKVLDQATVYLIFRDGSTNLKLNIGMVLDHQEIVDTDTAEVGEVSNKLERFPARSDSLAGLQRSVAHAQRYERQHAKRERWLRPPGPFASTDHLITAASPPIRLPLRTVPTGSSSCTGYCRRKPTNNLYYDTRLRS